MKDKGIVIREPSVVAVDGRTQPPRVVAVGAEAKEMIGRTPGSITAVRPLKDGVITSDKRIVEALPTIKYLMNNGAKVILCSHMGKPHSIFTEGFGLTKKEKKAVEKLPEAEQAAAKAELLKKLSEKYELYLLSNNNPIAVRRSEDIFRAAGIPMDKIFIKCYYSYKLKTLKPSEFFYKSVMEDIAVNLPITEGVDRMMTILKRVGYKTAILSGGFTYFGNYLKSRFGFDYVYANELEVEDGKLTGRYTGEIVDGARKAELLRLLCQFENIDIQQSVAVGDGANDLPMLNIAGLGIAFHAKPKVRETARQSLSTVGLDGILYFLGLKDSWVEAKSTK